MNTLLNIFEQTIAREGQTVTVFMTDETFTCFFRRLSDGLNQRSTMTMYYPVDAPVNAGSIVTVNNENYILLNQETIENNVYYKSAIVKCNGIISTESALVMGLPFYISGTSSNDPTGDKYLSIIDGKAEVITEDCTLSQNLDIDDRFNAFGRTWKVTNIFRIDGICTLVIEVQADSDITFVYDIVFTDIAETGYTVGDTAGIDAYVTVNGNITEVDLTYTSSNTDVATIDDNGVITFVGYGSVYFTITCAEHDLSENTSTTTLEEVVEDVVTLEVSEMTPIYIGYADGESTVTIKRNGETVHDIAFSVSITDCTFADKLTVTTNQETGLITVSVPDKSTYAYKTFTLNVSVPDYELTNSQSVTIQALF